MNNNLNFEESSRLKNHIVVFLYLVIISCVLRGGYIAVPFFNVDEGVYATSATMILEGKTPYLDFWIHKPPGIVYLYALVFRLLGKNMVMIHLFLILWIIGIGMALYFLGSRMYGYQVGWIAAVFWSIFSTYYDMNDVHAANTEYFMILPVLLAWLVLFAPRGETLGAYFFTGVLLGVGTSFKQPALLFLLVPTAIIFFHIRSREQGWGQGLLKLVLLLSGTSLPLLGWVFYFSHKQAYCAATCLMVDFNIDYMQNISFLHFLNRFPKMMFRMPLAAPMLWTFGLATLIWVFRRYGRETAEMRKRTVLLVVWVFVGIVMASLGGRFFGHYFLPLFPVLCLLAGKGIELTLEAVSALSVTQLRVYLKTLLVIWIAFGIFLPMGRFHSSRTGDLGDAWINLVKDGRFPNWLYDRVAIREEDYEVAETIQASCDQNATIFIWGFYPQLYFMSERQPFSRIIQCNFLTGLSPGSPGAFDPHERQGVPMEGAWDVLSAELSYKLPQLIIDTSPAERWFYGRFPMVKYPDLYKVVKEKYRLMHNVHNVYIYELQQK